MPRQQTQKWIWRPSAPTAAAGSRSGLAFASSSADVLLRSIGVIQTVESQEQASADQCKVAQAVHSLS